jgi:hypothetical protein
LDIPGASGISFLYSNHQERGQITMPHSQIMASSIWTTLVEHPGALRRVRAAIVGEL